MKSIVGKLKIWLIATLVLIVAGMTIFGIFGFNQTNEYKNSFEVDVSIGVNVSDAGLTVKEASEKFFSDNGLKTTGCATLNEGERYIFKFNALSKDQLKNINDNLKTTVETALAGKNLSSLSVTVKTGETQPYNYKAVWSIVLALGLAAVAVLAYYTLLEKFSGALTVLCASAISGVLYISLAALTRVPFEPVGGACLALSILLAGVLSGSIVNKCRELSKNVGNDKKSLFELGDMATKSSIIRFALLLSLIVLFAIVLVIVGSALLKFTAIQIVLASVSAFFTAFTWSGIFWAYFKGFSKTKKYKQTQAE
ncbi:MAG: hypothetical protein E7369_01365 [Clostridiales bacterium]|nr:hypothetical protein [Clostridiales bacterium]